jgi:hypothetical protein
VPSGAQWCPSLEYISSHHWASMGTGGHQWAPVGTTGQHMASCATVIDVRPAVPSGAQWCPSLEYISSHHWASMGTGGHQWAPVGTTGQHLASCATVVDVRPAVPSGAQWCPVVPITRVHQFPSLGIYGHRWAPVGTSGHHRAALGVVRDSRRRAPGGAQRCPVVPSGAHH